MTATSGMNDCEVRGVISLETYTEQMMPMLGGGTGMNKDQFYKNYAARATCAGDIDKDYAAMLAAKEAKSDPREKCYAIFDFFDTNGNGTLEIEEVWKLMTATSGMNDCEVRGVISLETYTEQMMPMLGGGTGMNKDQFYMKYCDFAGDIDKDYAAMLAAKEANA